MPFTTINKMAVGDDLAVDLFGWPVIDDLNFLNDQITLAQQAGISNGSFESPTAGANEPPNSWSLVAAGVTNTYAVTANASNVKHGSQAWSCTTPGSVSGGVVIETENLYACSDVLPLLFNFYTYSTAAGMLNEVLVNWYDATGVTILSTTTIWSSTSNPAAYALFQISTQPPSGARFFTLEVVSANNSVAGTVFWDGFSYVVGSAVGPVLIQGAQTTTYVPTGGSLRVKLCGAGGGGGGGGGGYTGSVGASSAGGNTTITVAGNTYTARGGSGGSPGTGYGSGGAGGSAAGDLIAQVIPGVGFQYGTYGGTNGSAHGAGGAPGGQNNGLTISSLAGGASGSPGSNGPAVPSGSGAGGPGGGGGGTGGDYGGGGGAGAWGEIAEYVIPCTPGQACTVVIGAGGAGGGGGDSGSNKGGSGATGGDGWAIISG